MPTYEYWCRHCQHKFEEIQSMLEAKHLICPKCREPWLLRLIGRGSSVEIRGPSKGKHTEPSVGQSTRRD